MQGSKSYKGYLELLSAQSQDSLARREVATVGAIAMGHVVWRDLIVLSVERRGNHDTSTIIRLPANPLGEWYDTPGTSDRILSAWVWLVLHGMPEWGLTSLYLSGAKKARIRDDSLSKMTPAEKQVGCSSSTISQSKCAIVCY